MVHAMNPVLGSSKGAVRRPGQAALSAIAISRRPSRQNTAPARAGTTGGEPGRSCGKVVSVAIIARQ
jgi:hypothetical protein